MTTDLETQAPQSLAGDYDGPEAFFPGKNVTTLVSAMPPELQLKILQIAQAVGVTPDDDLIYSLLVGLGLHQHLVSGVPDEIRTAAGEAEQRLSSVAEQIMAALAEQREAAVAEILAAGREAGAEIKANSAQLADQVLIAARSGAAKAVAEIDLTKIVAELQNKADEMAMAAVSKHSFSLFRDWFGKGLVIAGVAVLFSVIAGGFFGWFVKPDPSADELGRYKNIFSQLNCRTVNNQYFCSDKAGGEVRFK